MEVCLEVWRTSIFYKVIRDFRLLYPVKLSPYIQHLNPQFIVLLLQNHHRSTVHLISSTNNNRIIITQFPFRW